jgi:hypothetical protein
MAYEKPTVVTLSLAELENATLQQPLEGGGGGCECQCQCQCQCQTQPH